MMLEDRATGEHIAARLVEHSGLLCLKVGSSELIALSAQRTTGRRWRIIDVRAGERAVLAGAWGAMRSPDDCQVTPTQDGDTALCSP